MFPFFLADESSNAREDPDLINGYVIFDYEWSGEKLILTWVDEYSSDGVQHPLIQKVGGQEHMTFLRLPD